MQINFEVFGDRNTASSRLRAWMVADELERQGHTTSVGGSTSADLVVFQKVRTYNRLREARSRGAITVYDFDDNYLLEETGARSDIVGFINSVDVVTVGSRELLDRARRLHDHVHLFENPLDVLPESQPKTDHSWEGRVGWFGARSNLSALHDVGLANSVRTITKNGDVEWSLATVDRELKNFDLVVLPVSLDAWTVAKNANRMLKCIALGVPVLASRTAEHEHVVRELGLPDWLLVGRDDDWKEQIAKVGNMYEQVVERVLAGGQQAWARFGIENSARDWLRAVGREAIEVAPALSLDKWQRAYFQEMDVVVGGHGDSESTLRTVESLRLNEVQFGSVAVSACDPLPELDGSGVRVIDDHDDFFDTYSAESQLITDCSHARLLYVRGGVELTRGFFNEVPWVDDSSAAVFVNVVAYGRDLGEIVSVPTRLDQVIETPVFPLAGILPGHLASASESGVKSAYGPLGIWEFLVRQGAAGEISFQGISDPLLRADSGTIRSNPMTQYAAFVEKFSPELVNELPDFDNEWDRLRSVLLSAAISDNHSVFSEYVSTIVPRLDTLLSRARRVGARLPSRISQDFRRSRKWATELGAQASGAGGELVRLPDGRVLLLDGELRRHVPSGIVLAGIEQILGETTEVGEGAAEAYLDGPPVVVHTTEGEEPFVVIGGVRHRVRGFPMPVEAPEGVFGHLTLSEVAVDLGRANVPRSLYTQLRSSGSSEPARSHNLFGTSWRVALRRMLRRSWTLIRPLVPAPVRGRLRTAVRSFYRGLKMGD